MKYYKITHKEFTRDVFDVIVQELPLLKDYLDCTHDKKNQRRVVHAKNDGEHRTRMALRNKIFYPEQERNKRTNKLMPNLGKITATDVLKERYDTTKDESDMLSSIGRMLSWNV